MASHQVDHLKVIFFSHALQITKHSNFKEDQRFSKLETWKEKFMCNKSKQVLFCQCVLHMGNRHSDGSQWNPTITSGLKKLSFSSPSRGWAAPVPVPGFRALLPHACLGPGPVVARQLQFHCPWVMPGYKTPPPQRFLQKHQWDQARDCFLFLSKTLRHRGGITSQVMHPSSISFLMSQLLQKSSHSVHTELLVGSPPAPVASLRGNSPKEPSVSLAFSP